MSKKIIAIINKLGHKFIFKKSKDLLEYYELENQLLDLPGSSLDYDDVLIEWMLDNYKEIYELVPAGIYKIEEFENLVGKLII